MKLGDVQGWNVAAIPNACKSEKFDMASFLLVYTFLLDLLQSSPVNLHGADSDYFCGKPGVTKHKS